MKRLMYVILGLSFITLIGCNTNSVNDEDELTAWEQKNMAEIESVLDADADLNFDALDDENEDNINSDDPNWLGSESLSKTNDTRIHFGRIRLHPVERSVQIVFEDDTTKATAYVYTKLKGIFVVRKATIDSNSVEYLRFQKPMIHEIERIVHLEKVHDTEFARRNWKIVDISMKNGKSPDATVEIVGLTVTATGQEPIEILDALDYFMSGTSMFIFPRLSDVQLRVVVKNSSANPMVYPEGTQATEIVRLHYGRNRLGNFARKYFTWVGQDDAGNNIYEGEWTIWQLMGIHHAVIDVVDNGTVLSSDNDAYPYNSNTWATPYVVTPF